MYRKCHEGIKMALKESSEAVSESQHVVRQAAYAHFYPSLQPYQRSPSQQAAMTVSATVRVLSNRRPRRLSSDDHRPLPGSSHRMTEL